MNTWGKRMLGGVATVLVGSGIITLGGKVALVVGTALVVVGICVTPYLTGFGDDS